MHIKVDQSVKIEQTSDDTVLAYADDKQFAILIPAQVKRRALVYLRGRGWFGKRAVLPCFAAGLFLLLQDIASQVTLITIDREYQGHEADIQAMLLRHMRQAGLEFSPDVIRFERLGKKSRAHQRAWGVQRGKITPDHEVTVEEFLEVFK
jgi:hypothetical protein